MKNKKITGLLALALASGMVLSSCGKSTGNKRSKKTKAEDSEISMTEDSEEPETTAQTPETGDVYFEPIDQCLSDIQKGMVDAPETLENGVPVQIDREAGQLGIGNMNNGGFATGDENYQFYVVHPIKYFTAIAMEDWSTKDEYYVYQVTPDPNAENSLDSLIYTGDSLYFRENSSVVKKIDLATHMVSPIIEGEVHLLTLYQGKLYYSLDGAIRRSDLDGKNEEVLYASKTSDENVSVSFCISGTQIFYCDPQERSDDGVYYGKLFSMNLDGSHLSELPIDAKIRNNDALICDGEKLYFDGTALYDDGTEYTGPMSVNLDGSDMFFYEIQDIDSKFNFLNGKLYIVANNRCVEMDGLNRTDVVLPDEEPGSVFAYGVTIVGKWFYVMSYNPAFSTEYVTDRDCPEAWYKVTLDRY